MKLNEKIIAERERLGLTQEALGQKVGVSKVTISRWEAERDIPRFKHVEAIAKVFGRPLAWFSNEAIPDESQYIREKEGRAERKKLKSILNEAKQFFLRSLEVIDKMSGQL